MENLKMVTVTAAREAGTMARERFMKNVHPDAKDELLSIVQKALIFK